MVEAPPAQAQSSARATLESDPKGSVVKLGGDWRLEEHVPAWKDVVKEKPGGGIRVVAADLGKWDTSLVLFLTRAHDWCEAQGVRLDLKAVPAALQTVMQQTSAPKPPAEEKKKWSRAQLLITLGTAAQKMFSGWVEVIRFIGDSSLGLVNAARHPARFRWKDCAREMQQCGPGSLPIVCLISFLVGVIMAFQAVIQLRQFGADLLVADLVGLVVVREMGPMMAAVMLSGRTGAAFAAQIGNMKVREEVDALETLGISPIDFLVLPRLVALGIMMPLLTIYANVVGILGGLFISATMLNIPAWAYWVETQQRVTLGDFSSGLFKSIFFGLLVGLAGCLRGLQCSRGSNGVGRATTSAVVTGIVLIIVCDAIFSVVYNVLGI
jgi:phospholipid/cholesterol/gamma-HCH transport system permease protein